MHVRRAVAGESGSVSWLVERLSPLLAAQASWRLGPLLRPLYDPEDLVSDAWLRLLPELGGLPPRDGRFTPVVLRFLSTAILNRVNNLVKKHLRSGSPAAPAAGLPDDAEAGPLAAIPADVTGAVSAAVRQERHRTVAEAIDALGPQDREIVILRGVEQRANATVAELLGIAPEAAAMRYHRALKRLRDRLPGSAFDEL